MIQEETRCSTVPAQGCGPAFDEEADRSRWIGCRRGLLERLCQVVRSVTGLRLEEIVLRIQDLPVEQMAERGL